MMMDCLYRIRAALRAVPWAVREGYYGFREAYIDKTTCSCCGAEYIARVERERYDGTCDTCYNELVIGDLGDHLAIEQLRMRR